MKYAKKEKKQKKKKKTQDECGNIEEAFRRVSLGFWKCRARYY